MVALPVMLLGYALAYWLWRLARTRQSAAARVLCTVFALVCAAVAVYATIGFMSVQFLWGRQ